MQSKGEGCLEMTKYFSSVYIKSFGVYVKIFLDFRTLKMFSCSNFWSDFKLLFFPYFTADKKQIELFLSKTEYKFLFFLFLKQKS